MPPLSSQPILPDNAPSSDTPSSDAAPSTRLPLRMPLVSRARADFLTPGVVVEHTRAEADAAGAFVETAMSWDDAWESNADVAAAAAALRAAGATEGRTRG